MDFPSFCGLTPLTEQNSRTLFSVNNCSVINYVTFWSRRITNLEYRLGDQEQPALADQSVDLVLLSQAPHHAGNPAQALQAAFLTLKPGGRVVVLDLLAHQFEQARELYADQWLGFTEAALLGLLEEAGFKKAEVEVVSRDEANPVFQTLLAIGFRAGSN